VVARCASHLATYATQAGEHPNNAYHQAFLHHAARAVLGDLDSATLKHLEAVRVNIPRAKPLFEPERVVEAAQREGAEETKRKTSRPKVSRADTANEKAIYKAIEEDPDTPDSYLILADLLQARGDVRGELIALQHAGSGEAARKPTKARRSADALIAEHGKHLLGKLASVTKEEIALQWERGFIHTARLRFRTHAGLLKGLNALLSSPSATFLQQLFIERLTAPPEKAVEVLLKHGGPPTLKVLHIGEPGAWQANDAILEAFPRLARDENDAWAEAVARIAEQKRLKPDFEATGLSPLQPLPRATEGPLPSVTELLIGLKAELGKQRALGLVAAMSTVYTATSLDAFCCDLAEQWERQGEKSAQRYGLEVGGYLGGNRCVAFVSARLQGWSHQRAVQGIELLSRIGSPAALMEIERLMLTTKGYHPRRDEARGALIRVAEKRDLSMGRLLDRHGCPHPPAGDVTEAQRLHLEDLLLSGHRIARTDFAEYYVDHPTRRPLAAMLLWGAFEGRHLRQLLRVTSDGKLVDATGTAIQLKPKHVFGVAHPAEAKSELEEWRDVFEKLKIKQPFLQLDRPVFQLAAKEKKDDVLRRYDERRRGYDRLNRMLTDGEWRVWEQCDGGGTESYARYFSRDDCTIVASIGGGGSLSEVTARSTQDWNGSPRAIGKLHPVVLSELLWDLERALPPPKARASGEKKPDAEETAPPARLVQQGEYPMVEKAKSSRAKCIVCGEKIEKDTIRIGVEREIETERFSGRVTAWLHPSCREGCPELEGVELDV
ncbi:MAG: DUF4132 domain-containing protein, partial [Deltaproteobacteria bacterium]|nr:DUF4132 domain-containing protein [Deltaproteobacteria bacterium]